MPRTLTATTKRMAYTAARGGPPGLATPRCHREFMMALDRHQFDVILMRMEIHVDAIRRDLVATASALGDDSLADALRRLVDASEPALRLRLQDVLSEAAVSLNGQLASGHVEVRLAGREPEP